MRTLRVDAIGMADSLAAGTRKESDKKSRNLIRKAEIG
jgi:hypothetical protein